MRKRASRMSPRAARRAARPAKRVQPMASRAKCTRRPVPLVARRLAFPLSPSPTVPSTAANASQRAATRADPCGRFQRIENVPRRLRWKIACPLQAIFSCLALPPPWAWLRRRPAGQPAPGRRGRPAERGNPSSRGKAAFLHDSAPGRETGSVFPNRMRRGGGKPAKAQTPQPEIPQRDFRRAAAVGLAMRAGPLQAGRAPKPPAWRNSRGGKGAGRIKRRGQRKSPSGGPRAGGWAPWARRSSLFFSNIFQSA